MPANLEVTFLIADGETISNDGLQVASLDRQQTHKLTTGPGSIQTPQGHFGNTTKCLVRIWVDGAVRLTAGANPIATANNLRVEGTPAQPYVEYFSCQAGDKIAAIDA